MDPLARKYASLSPYNYVAGNPIIYVDPDGREIKIGKWYQFGFRRKIKRSLKRISKTAEGRKKVELLKGSSNVHRFVKGKGKGNNVKPTTPDGSVENKSKFQSGAFQDGVKNDRSGRVGTGEGTGSIVTISDESSVDGATTLSTVAHEMQHSVDIDNGELNVNRMDPIGDDAGRKDGKGAKISEYRAVQFENHVRVNNGMSPRDTYNEGKNGTRTGLNNVDQDYEKNSGLENENND